MGRRRELWIRQVVLAAVVRRLTPLWLARAWLWRRMLWRTALLAFWEPWAKPRARHG
jgi:hypothetical protein